VRIGEGRPYDVESTSFYTEGEGYVIYIPVYNGLFDEELRITIIYVSIQ